MATAPVETKVYAAGGGAGAGAVIGQFVDYLLGATVYRHGSVPGPVADVVALGCAGIASAAMAWLAPHTSRPTDNPAPPAG